MPFSRTSMPLLLNTGNLLAGITPTFTNWAVEPGTIADMVSEAYGTPITTPGTSNAAATIRYDLGRPYRLIGFTDNQHPDMITWASLDAVTWQQCTLDNVGSFAGVYRYIELRLGAHVGIQYIKTIVYKV